MCGWVSPATVWLRRLVSTPPTTLPVSRSKTLPRPRSALEKMIAALPETHFSRVHSLPMSGSRREAAPSSNLFALFDCIIDPETGTYLSEDYSFCLRWRRIGGEIWLDAASKLTHWGPYEFVGNHASRFYGVTGSKDSTAAPR